MKNNEFTTTTNNTADIDQYRALMLQLLDHAVENTLNEENKKEALHITRLYFGDECDESGAGFKLITGFLMGVNEGMRLAQIIEEQ